MRFFQPLTGQVAMRARWLANVFMCGVLLCAALRAGAQDTPPVQPAVGSSCTVSALNRNAPVAPDSSFTIYNIPGNSGPFRARATCSDGMVGQTAVAFPELGASVVYTGDIVWGRIDPTPVALGLRAASKQLGTDQTAQLVATAVAADASTHDVTLRAQGTSYAISNALLASVTPDGLVTVLPLFASGSSARVVASATNEGGVAGSYMFVLGPRGSLSGKVTRADGVSPVAGAQVSIVRNQPMEQVGTVVTDAAGNFSLNDVNAGSFSLSVIDPVTGDRGQAASRIDTEGEVASAAVRLNGQGQVTVTVTDAANSTVGNAVVTLTALGGIRDTRTLATDGSGKAVFNGVAAGDFTVSTRDPASMLVGTAVGLLPVGGAVPVALKLQPVGAIKGTVYQADGSNAHDGVQVRILSRERGIVSQVITGPDGTFAFNTLPLGDGPFTLDAFVDGRLRTRMPGIILSTPNQLLTQDLRFTAVGTVRGLVTDADHKPFDSVVLTLQSLEGLRLSFTATAGADGAFLFQGVPIGNFTLAAGTADGRTASATGNVASDGVVATANLQLAASGLIGTVFQRDGLTPVGEGVQVYLMRNPLASQLTLTLGDTSPAVLASTRTNTLGQYSFAVSNAASYVIQAQDGDNRARSQAVITTIIPGQPLTVNLAYLGKGLVSGYVRDSTGAVQPGSPVRVSTVGAFSNSWETAADATGYYQVPNVYVGDVAVSAQHTASKLTGLSNGRLIAEGDSLSLDVTLAATGTVQGTVLKSTGAAAGAPLLVELYVGSTRFSSQTLASGNSYTFTMVPLGDVSVRVTEIATGDKGMAASKLTTANEVRTVNLKLIGQGALRVRVQDAANQPVAGARVTVRSLSAFAAEATLVSDTAGIALVQPFFNGDVTVDVSKPAQIGQISGSAQGTIANGATLDLAVTLTVRPVGKFMGTVFGPDGITPRANMEVALAAGGSTNYRTITNAQGQYVLENVEGGVVYTATVRKSNPNSEVRDRIRAQLTGLQIVSQGDIVTRNFQMIGSGEVTGLAKKADGTPLPGVKVTFNNPDPVYGVYPSSGNGNYDSNTDADGRFTFHDVAAGNFTLVAIANSAGKTLRAEGAGRVRFDGDAVAVDLTLVDDAVTMPQTLYDANAIPFDVTGDGSVANGKNRMFTGSGPDARGMRLDVLVGGVPVPFLNGDGSVGRLTANGQQLELDELHTSGLTVTRRIYVPKTGYFARYLEVFENRTQAPITVDVRVSSHHSESNSNPRIVDTSDGDNVLSLGDAINRDRWLVVDDQQDADPFKTGSAPATGHVFDGAGAGKQADDATYELIGQTGKLTLQWNSITVQPGQSTALMHFAFSQLDRYRAREAALRLAQLPLEALAGLTPEERLAIANFAVPADGASAVPALPELGNGEISGHVLSGDGTTPIAKATVHFKSKQVLFGRDFEVQSDDGGNFRFAARINGTADNLPIPLYGFDIDAIHPITGAPSSASVSDFAEGTHAIVQDLILSGTGNLRGTVTRATGPIVADAMVNLYRLGAGTPMYSTKSGVDGTFLMTGIPPSVYTIAAIQAHPQAQNGGRGIEGSVSATAFSGATTVAAVVLEPVGSVTGLVRSAAGAPVVGVQLQLYDSMERMARTTITDTAGRYHFSDVKLGLTRIEARDNVSNAGGSASVTVAAEQEAVADIGLKGFGTINVQVNFARGAPAAGAVVLVQSSANKAVTDSAGRATFSLPVGSYGFIAQHPDNAQDPGLYGAANVTLAGNGDIASVTLTLKATGAIKGTIVRPDGSTLAGGFPYTVKLLNGANNQARGGGTDAAGNFRIAGLALGTQLFTAFDPVLNRFADAEVVLTTDGEEFALNLKLEADRIALPANLLDANRAAFDIQQDGSVAHGSSTFDGAAVLEVNGERYLGDTSAALEIGKRQFAISQGTTMAGLNVTRKVFVPKGGYFARYLEVFDNPTDAPITVEAKLSTTYADVRLISSSSKQAAVNSGDNWVVLDDALDADPLLSDSPPASAHIHGQPGAAGAPDQLQMLAAGGTSQQLVQRWSSLTVPAGAKVVLMHFVVQQVNRNGAIASAMRLTQLPPEAMDGLLPAESAAIANFVVPADHSSTVPALASLTASLNGRVVEGDGVTPVNGVRVTFQSAHPLFNRVWGARTDPQCSYPGTPLAGMLSALVSNPDPALVVNGAFSVQGVLTDNDSIAVPSDSEIRLVAQEASSCYSYYAGHAVTGIPSRVQILPPGPVHTQNVGFDSGIMTGTISGPPGLGITSGKVYRSADDQDGLHPFYVPIAADGTYVLPGLPPAAYDMIAEVPHPQGSKLRGERLAALITLARTTVTDISLQATGALAGTILTANGEPSVNAAVVLDGVADGQQYDACAGCASAADGNRGKRATRRTTRTDSLGRYSFSAVPVGAYLVTATDPVSLARRELALAVGEGQNAVQNVTLLALGSVRLNVMNANGTPSADATVFVLADAEGAEKIAGRTAGGQLTIANVPMGNYQLRVMDPRFSGDSAYQRVAAGAISANGEVQQQSITLLSVASVRVTVQDGDNANAAVPGATIRLNGKQVGASDAAGKLTMTGLKEGALAIDANQLFESRPVSVAGQAMIGIAEDNSVIDLPLQLKRTVGSISIAVLDADNGNAALKSARIYLQMGAGAKNFIGTADDAGYLFIPGVAPGTFQLTVQATLDGVGDQLVLNGSVTPSNIGKTQALVAGFKRSILKKRVLSFVEETHLYSVPLNVGDTLSVGIKGAAIGSTLAAYAVRTSAYDARGSFKASGLGYGPAGNYQQYNENGDLKSIRATTAGNYTLAVTLYSPSPSYLGGYELGASVNGVPVAPMAYLDGGTVAGTLTRSDGLTAVSGGRVRLQSTGQLGLYVENVADEAGHFLFTGVPVGAYSLMAMSGDTVVATAQGVLDVPGTTLTTNLKMVPLTVIRVSVKNVTGSAEGGANVRYVSGTNSATTVRADANGLVTLSVLGDTPISVSATSSGNSLVRSTIVTVNPVDAVPVDLVLTVVSASLSGKVVSATGAPVSQALIKVNLASDPPYTSLVSLFADSSGNFSIPVVPASQELIVSAGNYFSTSSPPGIIRLTAAAGQAVENLVIVMPGLGKIKGSLMLSTGRPAAGQSIRASWLNLIDPYSHESVTAQADANGNFILNNVPTGTLLTLTAYYAGSSDPQPTVGTTATLANGEVLNLPPLVFQLGAVVRASLKTADDSIDQLGWCTFQLQTGVVSHEESDACSAVKTFVQLPAGPVSVTIGPQGRPAYGTVQLTAVDGSEVGAVVPVLTVSGKVSYADGAPVAYPTVYLIDSAGEMLYPNWTEMDGSFLIYGVRYGQFTLTAQDASGLTSTSKRTPTDPTVVFNAPVSMPPFGTVSGTVSDVNNLPVANAQIYLRNGADEFERTAATDAQGQFSIDKVGLGTLIVSANDGSGRNPVSATVRMDSGGQIVTVNLRFPVTGTVSGKVVRTDGVTPAANANVILRLLEAGGAYNGYSSVQTTDAAGSFAFADVPPGMVRLVASAANLGYGSAVAAVSGSANSFASLRLGTDAPLPFVLVGDDGYDYAVAEDAAVSAQRHDQGASYLNYYGLMVNGVPFSSSDTARTLVADREYEVGPRILSGLSVTRRYFVPAGGGYVRIIDSFMNASAADINAVAKLRGPAQFGSDGLVGISLLAQGTGYAIYTTPSYYPESTSGFMTVFQGASGGLAPSAMAFNTPDSSFSYGWNLLVPAGKTVSLMHFSSLYLQSPLSDAQARANALTHGTEPGMLNGLSSADKASIKNFTLP